MKKSAAGWTFLGRPVTFKNSVPFLYADGAFTCAASLRGPAGICADLLEDPDYAHELLKFINDAFIARIGAWRRYFGQPEKIDDQGMADDSVEMLSVEQYREFVLPRHRDYLDALGTDKGRGIHLCGNAQRLFPTLHQELGIMAFDTGFPVDFARFRKEMGPEVLISGGPRAPLFVEETPDALLAETRRILETGVLEGGRFILQEGNNLPPCASLDHCGRFYKLGRTMGRVNRPA
jgi:uroporphyrinogen-III decarboxylase